MPIPLGVKPQAGFDQPLELLADCHRRVEHFLDLIVAVAQAAQRAGAGTLNDEERRALKAALDYFRTAAPRHTQDEEASLFPRLRASPDPRAAAALGKVAALESDHQTANPQHDEVEALGQQLLAAGRLDAGPLNRLIDVADSLRHMYARHIAVEETEIFPLAGQILSPSALAAVGREMADRRGVKLRMS